MDDSLNSIRSNLQRLAEIGKNLRSFGVIRSQRIIPDYGEWIACRILGASLADSRTQKGWDVEIAGKRIQVKTHAKALTNRAHRTPIPNHPEYNELLIVVLTPCYLVSKIFRVPVEDVKRLRKEMGRKWTLEWKELGGFQIQKNKLAAIKPLLETSTST